MVLSKRANLNLEIVVNAIKMAWLAGNRVLDLKFTNMTTHDFIPGFKVDLHLKDINNVLSFGNHISADLLITNLTHNMLEKLASEGKGAYDHRVIFLNYDL